MAQRRWSLAARFKQLSFWNKFAVIGSICSIIGVFVTFWPTKTSGENNRQRFSYAGENGAVIVGGAAELRENTFTINQHSGATTAELQLQREVDELRELNDAGSLTNSRLIEGFRWTAKWAQCLGERHPDFERLADSIEDAIERAERDGASHLSSLESELLFLVAKAEVANVNRDFQHALFVLDSGLLDKLISGRAVTDRQLARLHTTRADALLGLSQWQDALESYERAASIGDESLRNVDRRAKCLINLKKLEEADQLLSRRLPAYRSEVQTTSEHYVQCLNSHAVAIGALGRHSEAERVYRDALRAAAETSENESQSALAEIISAIRINRSANLVAMGRLSDADKEFRTGLQGMWATVDQTSSEYLNHLAGKFCHQGYIYANARHAVESLAYFDRAVDIRNDLADVRHDARFRFGSLAGMSSACARSD